MGKIAFVFSGQGAQFPGMGKELYEHSPEAKAVFDEAEAIRPGTIAQCFEGTEEELKETVNTQPCMYAVELAAAAALSAAGVRADVAAGFSLGEISALAYTGMVSREDGFRLVTRRGELMQADAEATPTAMAAVLRLPNEKVEELCAQYPQMYPVNYNYNGQVSCSGLEEHMADFQAAVKAAGGLAKPLKVKGGFHSPFMANASAGLEEELKGYAIGDPQVPLYSDYTGELYQGDPKELLAKQVCNPVRWESIVKNMIASGVDTFVELGPGHTLVGLIKKIDPNVKRFTVAGMEDVEAVAAEVKTC